MLYAARGARYERCGRLKPTAWNQGVTAVALAAFARAASSALSRSTRSDCCRIKPSG